MVDLQSVCDKLQEQRSISATEICHNTFHNTVLLSVEYQRLLQVE